MCIFIPIGKNTDALFLHILDSHVRNFCLATVGAMCFSCVASAAHFLFYRRLISKADNKEILAIIQN